MKVSKVECTLRGRHLVELVFSKSCERTISGYSALPGDWFLAISMKWSKSLDIRPCLLWDLWLPVECLDCIKVWFNAFVHFARGHNVARLFAFFNLPMNVLSGLAR